MLHALQWLVLNNKYYKYIRINADALALLLLLLLSVYPKEGASLALLPKDGDLTNLQSVYVESTSDHIEDPSGQNDSDDTYNTILSGSFVPSAAHRMTEQETVRQCLQQQLEAASPTTVSWPTIGSTPINEFTTEGYISCAFPTLFPTGAADFIAPRPLTVTIGNYFKHLMMYQDGRFAKHPRFRRHRVRWRAL